MSNYWVFKLDLKHGHKEQVKLRTENFDSGLK